jgi:ribonuclease P protein component
MRTRAGRAILAAAAARAAPSCLPEAAVCWPARHRLRDAAQFRAAAAAHGGHTRRRAGCSWSMLASTDPTGVRSPRVGFVVSKAVGGAVVRNLVTRRLRAATAPLLAGIPAGVDVVVRAQPAAATASYAELATELGSSLARSLRGLRGLRAGGRH